MSNISTAKQSLASPSRTTQAPPVKRGQLAAALAALATAEPAQSQATNLAAAAEAIMRGIGANQQELQKYIREERKNQGLTQIQLAIKCGLSQGTITRAERNGWISFSCLMRIAAGLGRKVIIQ